jgi:hypothetical protein
MAASSFFIFNDCFGQKTLRQNQSLKYLVERGFLAYFPLLPIATRITMARLIMEIEKTDIYGQFP